MLQFYSASTAIVNSKKAIRECLEIALEGEPNLDCDLIIIHSSIGHNFEELLGEACRLAPSAQIAGCTGAGVIGAEGPNESMKALAVMAVKGPKTEFAIAATGSLPGEAPVQQAYDVARALRHSNPHIRHIYFLPPWGEVYIPSRTIESIESVFGPEVSIFGGTSTDNMKGISSFGFLDDQILEKGTVMIGFADPSLHLYCQASHGMKVLKGTAYEVTRLRDEWILELNGQPAWKLILSALGLPENASMMEAFVLGFLATEFPEDMREAFGYDYYLTSIWGDPEAGSIISLIEMEEGMVFYLAKRDEELMFRGVDRIAHRIRDHVKGKTPVAVFQSDCLIRGRLSFNRDLKDELLKRMQIPICGDNRLPWLGFYASGEFSRIGGKNGWNGFTSTICMLYRKNE
jgi:hypothetical protein